MEGMNLSLIFYLSLLAEHCVMDVLLLRVALSFLHPSLLQVLSEEV